MIIHKTDVGGVKLNVLGEKAVREAWHDIEYAIVRANQMDDFDGVTIQPMVRAGKWNLS